MLWTFDDNFKKRPVSLGAKFETLSLTAVPIVTVSRVYALKNQQDSNSKITRSDPRKSKDQAVPFA